MLVRPRVLKGAIARKSVLAAAALILVLAPQAASARHRHHTGRAAAGPVSPTWPNKDAALILDGETGKVLYARNANELRYPASLTKIMTLYMLFDAMKKGQITLQTPMTVSAHAASQAPVKLYMTPGDTITVEQAIKAIVVRSANDVAVVIAEKLGGSESQFAEMMTAQAHKLGMVHTHYADASGLPNREQITTAADLGILARHVAYDFPQYYHYFATPSFTFRGHTWDTHDNLIGHYKGADGMKTGYTVMSGFNLVSSVVRGGSQVIGVVMGGRTAHLRDNEMERLLDQTFARIQQTPTLVASAGVPWHDDDIDARRPTTVIAGFDIGGGLVPGGRQVVGSAAPTLRPAGAVDPNDEDAAETGSDTDDNGDDQIANLITPAAPQPRPAVYHPATPQPRPTMVSYHPQAPIPLPTSRGAALGNPPSALNALGLHDWTIQIGAYADATVARAQLAAYAEKSMDILGQSERIVVPFQGVDGHTLFRARFGPFAEREARMVCERLTERGQTCFAATAAR
jgi:D-alanyl-D-alanine carboxypeptidase